LQGNVLEDHEVRILVKSEDEGVTKNVEFPEEFCVDAILQHGGFFNNLSK